MEIGFSSERSIEDELEAISKGEVLTMVISYLVMFVYIALALGKIRSFKSLMVCFYFIKIYDFSKIIVDKNLLYFSWTVKLLLVSVG